MTLKVDAQKIADITAMLGLALDPADFEFFAKAVQPLASAHGQLADLIGPPPTTSRQVAWRYGGGADDPFNCWRVRTEIVGHPAGPATDRRVGVKDNIAVGGLPMTNGSRDFLAVPQSDAVAVAQLLSAGATIVGKTNCEAFASSGGSHVNDFGPVRNPRAPDRTSGGSSSGSAAAVASGECHWALGTDQGGSTRVPAAFCGVVGLKPSWGLVPYDGAIPVESTLDHIGLLTQSVQENRRMLEAIVGHGSRAIDPRRLRIGVVKEGFDHHNSDPFVDATVRRAAATFETIGFRIEPISIAAHRDSRAIFAGIACSGVAVQFLAGSSYPLNSRGPYDPEIMAAHRRFIEQGKPLPDTLLSLLLVGGLAIATDRGISYAHSQLAAARLRAAYDMALEHFDMLMMPTVPMRAPVLPGIEADRAALLDQSVDMFANCSAFNVTGHPALSMPCGPTGELPVGMMLVARHFHEEVIYAAGEAFEESFR
jgi:amidase